MYMFYSEQCNAKVVSNSHGWRWWYHSLTAHQPIGSYSAKTGDNDCNVSSSRYSLRTALCESNSLSGQVWTKCPTRPDTQGAPQGGCSLAPRNSHGMPLTNTAGYVYIKSLIKCCPQGSVLPEQLKLVQHRMIEDNPAICMWTIIVYSALLSISYYTFAGY